MNPDIITGAITTEKPYRIDYIKEDEKTWFGNKKKMVPVIKFRDEVVITVIGKNTLISDLIVITNALNVGYQKGYSEGAYNR